jgi:fatty acid-binding protein DegV
MSSSFYKQFLGAKKIQEEYSQQIINTLSKSNMIKAIMQINGGHISVAEKSVSHPLTMKKLEQLLHEYYKQHGGKDETKDIILFINANRGSTKQQYLKKTNIGSVPALQGP